ncbi:MAG TPA: choice-of-anchor D domain-containing protein [bacterium]|nr:choice-of-anchor D domain-containing protein [bacterium]
MNRMKDVMYLVVVLILSLFLMESASFAVAERGSANARLALSGDGGPVWGMPGQDARNSYCGLFPAPADSPGHCEIQENVYTPLVYSENEIYVQSSDGIARIDIEGDVKWTWAPDDGKTTGLRAVTSDHTIYAVGASVDNPIVLYSVNSGGQMNWSYTFPGDGGICQDYSLDARAGFLGACSILNRDIGDGWTTAVWSISPEGEVAWTYGSGSVQGLAVAESGNIYALIGSSFLTSLDADGNVRWRHEIQTGPSDHITGLSIGPGERTIFEHERSAQGGYWEYDVDVICCVDSAGEEKWTFSPAFEGWGSWCKSLAWDSFGRIMAVYQEWDKHEAGYSDYSHLFCMSPDGELQWTYTVSDCELARHLVTTSDGASLIYAEGIAHTEIHCINSEGELRWVREALPRSGLPTIIGPGKFLVACFVDQPQLHVFAPDFTILHCTSPEYANTAIAVEYEVSALCGLDHVELWYRYEGGSWADSSLRGYEAIGELSFEPPDGDGEYAFAVVAEDIEGHRSTLPDEAQATTVYDTSAPTSSASCEAYSTGSTVQVSYSASDTTSGVVSVSLWYRGPDSGRGWVDSGLSEAEPEGVFSFVAAADGVYEFATVAQDLASNTESLPEGPDCTVVVDTTAPVSSCASPGMVNQYPIEVEYSVTDETSGVASVELWFSYEGGTWTDSGIASTSAAISGSFEFSPPTQDDGTYAFATFARDRAGNVEALPDAPDATTLVDTIPPASSCSCDEVAHDFPVAVSYTATDAGSGVSSVALWYRFEGGDWANAGLWAPMANASFNFRPSVQSEGLYEFATIAEDTAGNGESLPDNPDCSVNVRFPAPRIVVSPESIDFGEVAVGGEAVDSIVVDNAGDAVLELYHVSINGDGFSLDLGEISLPCSIEPDNQIEFDVIFGPESASDYSGVVSVESNDPDEPSVEMNLAGSGSSVGGLVLRVFTDSSSYDFGDTIYLYVGANNMGDESEVDVYLFVCYDYLGPEHVGWYAVGGGWSMDIGPWLPGIVLAAGLDAEVLAFTIPTPAEPSDIIKAGEYTILMAAFEPVTFDWASNLAEATFSLQ